MTQSRTGGVVPGEDPRAGRPIRCAWCHRPVAQPGVGRPRVYCRRSCRQRAYESRRRAAELGLSDDELVVTRNELDDANDRLAEALEAADEARRDLGDGVAPARVVERLLASLSATLESNR